MHQYHQRDDNTSREDWPHRCWMMWKAGVGDSTSRPKPQTLWKEYARHWYVTKKVGYNWVRRTSTSSNVISSSSWTFKFTAAAIVDFFGISSSCILGFKYNINPRRASRSMNRKDWRTWWSTPRNVKSTHQIARRDESEHMLLDPRLRYSNSGSRLG